MPRTNHIWTKRVTVATEALYGERRQRLRLREETEVYASARWNTYINIRRMGGRRDNWERSLSFT